MSAPSPKVKITLPPILEAYCRVAMRTNPNEKEIKLRQIHYLTELIYANITVTKGMPLKPGPKVWPCSGNQVTFILPVDKVNEWYVKNHFISVTPWAERKIVKEVNYWFHKWIDRQFERGYKHRYSQDDIIKSIMRGLNQRNVAANYDTIKKIDYRSRRLRDEIIFYEHNKESHVFEL